jgi:alcohol dehydrogenase
MSRDGQSESAEPAAEVHLSSFQAATHIYFGPGAIARAGELVQKLGISRVLVVTDAGVMRAGIAGHALDALSASGVNGVVFDGVEPNPDLQTVQRALALYRARGCSGILAVGGGSVIDAAKATGVLATNPGELPDYAGVGKVAEPLPPLVTVPTTAGAGSEVTNFALILDRGQRRRLLVGSQLMAPDFALLDPGLILTLPRPLLAATALAALAQAVESLMSVFASPFSDAPAVQSIQLIAAGLPGALQSPALASHADLLYASTLAGLALTSARLGLAQAMAYALTAFYDVPSGLAAAILLPHVMRFNLPAADAALARAARALMSGDDGAAAAEAISRMLPEAGLPAVLADLRVEESNLPDAAAQVAETGSAQVVNPRRPAVDDILALYRAAL